MQAVTVTIEGADPISRAGMAEFLTADDRIQLAGPEAQVIVLVTGNVTAAHLDQLYKQSAPSVIVAARFEETLLMRAVECGVKAVIPRASVTREVLVQAIVAATEGSAQLPPRLQRILLEQLNTLRQAILEPNGVTLSGLTSREVDVLSLVAEGLRTEEIAEKVAYSPGTVKNVLYGVISRLGVRNRAEAVAYAIRAGAL